MKKTGFGAIFICFTLIPALLLAGPPQQTADPTPIQSGDVIEDAIFPNEDRRYSFEAQAGERVTISAVVGSGTADIMLQLLRPGGDLLFEDDDSNPKAA